MDTQAAKTPIRSNELDKNAVTVTHDTRSSSSFRHDSGSTEVPQTCAPGDDLVNPKEADNGEPGSEWIEGKTLFIAMMGVTLVTILVLLDMSIVSTAIPKITSQFQSLEDVAWYGSAYTISSATLQPFTGKLYHYLSSKWTFLGFFMVFLLGSLVCGVADSSKMLIVGRAVAGMGSSGILNGGLTIIAGSVPMHKRAKLIGMMMGIAQLGLVFSPLIGGAFTTYSTWRWCFYINLPVGGVVAILLVFTKIPDQRPKEPFFRVLPKLYKILDLIGFALFAPASIQLLIALTYGGNRLPWNSATVIGLFCGSGVAFILFLLWEWHMGTEAMLPFHVIKDRIVLCSSLVYMNVFGMTMILSYYLPIYFQSVKGYSPIRSGVDLLPSFVSQLFLAVVSTLLIGKLGYYLPWAVGGSVLNGIGNGLISTLNVHSPPAAWAGYQFFIGFGRGAAVQPPILAVQNAVEPDMLSIAMAILNTAQTFGGALALAFSGVIFTASLRNVIPQTAPTVNPEVVIAAGATAFREVVSAEQLSGVLVAFAKSVNRVFYLAAALCVCQFAFSWGIGWKDISKKGADKKAQEAKDNEKV